MTPLINSHQEGQRCRWLERQLLQLATEVSARELIQVDLKSQDTQHVRICANAYRRVSFRKAAQGVTRNPDSFGAEHRAECLALPSQPCERSGASRWGTGDRGRFSGQNSMDCRRCRTDGGLRRIRGRPWCR
jgi:hypothetical protein